jgi:molybdate transport system substrate-binding protein
MKNVVSQTTDVTQTVAQVALGQADAGFVYATDARTVKGKVGVIGLPKSAQPRVLYAAAAVKSSKHLQAAKAWVRRLLTRRAQEKLRAAGFLPVPR